MVGFGVNQMLSWCESPLSAHHPIALSAHHPIPTECPPPDSHWISLNEGGPRLFPWFAPGVYPNRFEPWKPSEWSVDKAYHVDTGKWPFVLLPNYRLCTVCTHPQAYHNVLRYPSIEFTSREKLSARAAFPNKSYHHTSIHCLHLHRHIQDNIFRRWAFVNHS